MSPCPRQQTKEFGRAKCPCTGIHSPDEYDSRASRIYFACHKDVAGFPITFCSLYFWPRKPSFQLVSLWKQLPHISGGFTVYQLVKWTFSVPCREFIYIIYFIRKLHVSCDFYSFLSSSKPAFNVSYLLTLFSFLYKDTVHMYMNTETCLEVIATLYSIIYVNVC